jgi:hypothetical protein
MKLIELFEKKILDSEVIEDIYLWHRGIIDFFAEKYKINNDEYMEIFAQFILPESEYKKNKLFWNWFIKGYCKTKFSYYLQKRTGESVNMYYASVWYPKTTIKGKVYEFIAQLVESDTDFEYNKHIKKIEEIVLLTEFEIILKWNKEQSNKESFNNYKQVYPVQAFIKYIKDYFKK